MDDIQRKLALLDKQLKSPKDSYEQLAKTSPLVFVAIGLIAGILLQSTLTESRALWFWLILLSIFTAATIFLFAFQNKFHFSLVVLLSFCALFSSLCLGAIRLVSFNQPAAKDIRNFVSGERSLATIRGTIITQPYTNKNPNWKFARFKFTDPPSSFYLKVSEVRTTTGWAKVTGTLRVQVAEPLLTLNAGDHIQAYCWLDKFKPSSNPGQFNTAEYLARKGIYIAASVKSRDGIELLRTRPSGIFPKIKRKFSHTAANALLSDVPAESQSRGLLQALLLGYRANIDANTYYAFRKTGLLHFISLSGMHLGILIAVIWWLSKTATLNKPARAIVCIIAIGIFLLVVPPRAPTLRAAIICLVFCLSLLFRRYPNPLNTLSLAAIILLLIRPTQLFEAGWQLSFATVLGILLLTEKIDTLFHEKTDFQLFADRRQGSWTRRSISKLTIAIIKLFSVGFSAWLGGAGILLYHFHTITPLASIWTVLVFPLVGAILTFGFLKMTLSFLLPTIAALLGVVVDLLSNLLIWIVNSLAHLNIAQILIGRVSLAPVVFYYCLIFFAAFACFRRPLFKKALCTILVLAMIVLLGTAKWHRTHRDNLVLTCLDVGHGQAVLARLPGKASCLFDAGSLNISNIGSRVVAPFLNYSGINKIDCLIISHNDIDHINAIPEITEQYKTDNIYANDAFFTKASRWSAAKFLNTSLQEKGFKIQPLDENLNLNTTAEIKILWPDKQIDKYSQLNDNDKSVVCLIEFAGRRMLLCSDIEKFAQRQILQFFPGLSADVVVVPHHGSTRTLDADFLKNLQPDILIYSCDRRLYEKQQTLKQPQKTKSFYTARDGAVTVCINKDGTIKTDIFRKTKTRH